MDLGNECKDEELWFDFLDNSMGKNGAKYFIIKSLYH